MSALTTIGFIFLYYMIGRAFVIYVWSRNYGLEDMSWVLIGWTPTYNDPPVPGVVWPIAGEVWIAVTLFWVCVLMPLDAIKNLGLNANKRAKDKEVIKERRKIYLSRLADYGLKPQDVPKYITKKEDLDEYLTIWDKHRVSN
jgi:hypothetical protein